MIKSSPAARTATTASLSFLQQYEQLEQAFAELGQEVPVIALGSPEETLLRMQKILHDLRRQRNFRF